MSDKNNKKRIERLKQLVELSKHSCRNILCSHCIFKTGDFTCEFTEVSTPQRITYVNLKHDDVKSTANEMLTNGDYSEEELLEALL